MRDAVVEDLGNFDHLWFVNAAVVDTSEHLKYYTPGFPREGLDVITYRDTAVMDIGLITIIWSCLTCAYH